MTHPAWTHHIPPESRDARPEPSGDDGSSGGPPLPRSASGVSYAVAETYHAIGPAFAPISRVMASSGTAQ